MAVLMVAASVRPLAVVTVETKAVLMDGIEALNKAAHLVEQSVYEMVAEMADLSVYAEVAWLAEWKGGE